MIIDANSHSNSEIETDICIVGAGAAGITIANEFLSSQRNILVVESGGQKLNKDLNDLFVGEIGSNKLHPPISLYRRRVLGGTTSVWGGRCVPYDDIDFETRDYIPNSGWPITLKDLIPYYIRANELCEAGAYEYTTKETFGDNTKDFIPGFISDSIKTDSLERFSKPTDFGKRYQNIFKARDNLNLLCNATCTKIAVNKYANSVSGLELKTLDHREIKIKAKHYVLAMGGLETPRLMLASNDILSNGVGNNNDNVGRYYMSHLSDNSASVAFDKKITNIIYDYERTTDDIYCRRRLSINPKFQHSNKVGNFIARLHYPKAWDPSHGNGILSALYLAKALIQLEYRTAFSNNTWGKNSDKTKTPNIWPHITNVVSDLPATINFAQKILRRRILADRKLPSVTLKGNNNTYTLDVNAEQSPNPNSRITILEKKDKLGVPRIKVDWQTNDLDLHTVKRSLEIIGEDLKHQSIGELHLDPNNIQLRAQGGHFIGTTRMSDNIENGVVDSNCKVFGLDNLYIAGSSVFCTSSHANPTLTIVALSLRLADHMRAARR